MPALTYVGPKQLEWRESQPRRLASDDAALVRPPAVAPCDLDALIVAGGSPFPPPFGIGHEGVAEVVEVGDRVTAVAPGQRGIVPFQVSCGTSRPASTGAPATAPPSPGRRPTASASATPTGAASSTT